MFAGAAQSNMLLGLRELTVELDQAVYNNNLPASISLFYDICNLLFQLQPNVRNTPLATRINQLIQQSNEITFKIRNRQVTLYDFRPFLTLLSNVELPFFDKLLNGAAQVIGSGVDAVMDDVNGMVNGVNVATNALKNGDILGAVTGAVGSVFNGKLNALRSLARGIGGLSLI